MSVLDVPDDPTYELISASFGEAHVEVSFRCPEEENEHCFKVKTLIVREESFRELVADIIDLFCDLIDAAEVSLRNPPQTITTTPEDLDEEDD